MAVLCFLIQAYALVVFARIVFEWIPVSYDHPVARVRGVLRAVTEPLLRPLRAILPPVRLGGVGLDLSPLVLMLALSLLAGVIC
ncbi:MAG: YggT family protein [Acidimicrobiia bacterium]|nr:YggT family protein [Acidimicrobiia bacterium]